MLTQSLRALLTNIVDYAGLFPPAALPLGEVVANYNRYLRGPESWLLNRLVLPLDELRKVEPADEWRLTVLVDGEPGPLPRQVETLEGKTGQRLSLPTYSEVPLDCIESGYAKIRTTSPDCESLAEFLCAAVQQDMPFKATAGLHHPIRSAAMHGFINVFAGATLAYLGMPCASLVRLLADTDPRNFEFRDDGLRWTDFHATTNDVRNARRAFAHSFGSCSFEEPVSDLRALGWLQ